MSFFKKFFGDSKSNTNEPDSKPTEVKEPAQKKPRVILLKDREKIQVLQTVSEKNYKIVRNEGATGDQIDHYQYYDDDGKGMTDFTQVLWLFDNMVKSKLANVKDHI